MKLEFGYGNIWVTSYGDKNGNYGVAFRIVPEKHIINASDPSVVGKTFDDVPHDLYMEFTKSQSVQVVINKLAMVRNDLRAAEHSVHPTAFGVGGRTVIPLQSSLFAEVPSATFSGR